MTITFGSAAVPSLNGFRVVLAIGAGAALVALTIAAFLPRHHRPSDLRSAQVRL
jgi:hypothetical protein